MNSDKATVFIVDDSRTSVAALKRALANGYRIVTTTKGQRALETIPEVLPDLILLDVIMPEIDGFEVCRRLKADPLTADIPIIFVTGEESVEHETKGLELGASDYVTKPISPPVVRARVRNLIELKLHRDQLKVLSTNDGLTGIANRRRFDELLECSWRQAFRRREPISLLMIDVDHFKAYNDNYGHLAGDDCLKKVAGRLKDFARRPGDNVARYGGEEFVCILSDTDPLGANEYAEMVLQGIRELNIPHEFSETSNIITASIGVATAIPREESVPEQLLDAADRALYTSKREGRNRISISDFT